jgi:hypothetical protein
MTAYMPSGWRGTPGLSRGSPMQGTGLVADDLYLLAHHDRTGKALVPPRVLGITLAAGLLAEMLIAESIRVSADGSVVPGDPRRLDPLTAHLHQVMLREDQTRPVRDWLLFSARTAADDIGARLQRSGFLFWSRRWWMPWRPRRVPVDPNWAFAAVIRATRPHSVQGAALAALVTACGLTFRLTESGNPPSLSHDDLLRALAPPVRGLIPHVQATVASVVLAHRT